jgi:hypothetical protein
MNVVPLNGNEGGHSVGNRGLVGVHLLESPFGIDEQTKNGTVW